MYLISYNVGASVFKLTTDNEFHALIAIESIVNKDAILFSDTVAETISEYMEILVKMKNGVIKSHTNYVFKIEVVDDCD